MGAAAAKTVYFTAETSTIVLIVLAGWRDVVLAAKHRRLLGGSSSVAFRRGRLAAIATLGAGVQTHCGVQVAEPQGDIAGVFVRVLEEERKRPANPRRTPGMREKYSSTY